MAIHQRLVTTAGLLGLGVLVSVAIVAGWLQQHMVRPAPLARPEAVVMATARLSVDAEQNAMTVPATQWTIEGPTRVSLASEPKLEAPSPAGFGDDNAPDVIAQAILAAGIDPLKDSVFAATNSNPTSGASSSAVPPRELIEALRREHRLSQVNQASQPTATVTSNDQPSPIASTSNPAATNHAPTTETTSSQTATVSPEALRDAGRQLQRTAEALEDQQAFEQAEAVRKLADQLRLESQRQLRIAREPGERHIR
ncbi:MAG: hypothetical protein JSS27_05730 [Planctomycetes bacterium]|nr:hypothetical protein [Planctomycetota bacterium]